MNSMSSGLDSLISLIYGLRSMMNPLTMTGGGMDMVMPCLLGSGLGSNLLPGAGGLLDAKALGVSAVKGGLSGVIGGLLGGAAQGRFGGISNMASGLGRLISVIYGLESMMNPLAMMGDGMGVDDSLSESLMTADGADIFEVPGLMDNPLGMAGRLNDLLGLMYDLRNVSD